MAGCRTLKAGGIMPVEKDLMQDRLGTETMAPSRTKHRSQSSIGGHIALHGIPASSGVVLFASGAVLIVAVVLAYINSLSGPFIFDDTYSVCENRHIRKLWPLTDAMFHAVPDSPPAGRPIVALSLAINYCLGGLNVRGYHIFNIAVHFASALVLWGVLRHTLLNNRFNERFGRSASFLAFAATLIWAVHPLATEAVNYVSQRTELLMGLFYLLTLYCVIRAWQSVGGRLWSVAAVASCAMGMGCKETMVSAPLFVLLYDITLVSSSLRKALRRHLGLYIGLAATWGLLVWLNVSGPRSQTCGAHLGMSILDYLRTQAGIIVRYLQLCFWPHPLVITYDDWPLAKTFTAVLPQGLLIVTLLALTAWSVLRRHPAGLLGAWFFMILAPTSSLIPIVTEIAAERRMYLPLVAVVIAAVIGSGELLRLVKSRLAISDRAAAIMAAIMLAFVASALGCGTLLRNRDYQTAIGIWSDAIAKRPQSWMALNNLRAVVLENGQYERAILYCNMALQRRPKYADGYYNRGLAHEGKSDSNQAIRDYTRAIELKPDHAKAYNNRGIAYGVKGDFDRAIQDCTKAIEITPDFADAYYNRGLAFGQKGDHDRAMRDFTKAIEIEPDVADAYNSRAASFYYIKQYDAAWRDVNMCRRLGGTHDSDIVRKLSVATGRTK